MQPTRRTEDVKRDMWANTAQTDREQYFIDEPPVNEHPTFATSDIWCAATLVVYGMEYLEFRLQGFRGKSEWVFDNRTDEAYQLAREFRTAGAVTVPVLELRAAYRQMTHAAAQARGGNQHDYHPYTSISG